MKTLIQHTFDNASDFSAYCTHMAGFESAMIEIPQEHEEPTPAKTHKPAKEVTESPKPPKKDPETAKPQAERSPGKTAKPAKKEDAPEAPTQGVSLATEPTFENVRKAILAVAKVTKSNDAARQILDKFGATKVGPELQEDDYEEVIADCQNVIDAFQAE